MGRPARGDGRGAHDGGRAGPRGARHPGHLGAHDLAVPRQAVDEGGAARGRRARPRRRPPPTPPTRSCAFADAIGFPLILKPRAGAGAQDTVRVDSTAELDARAGPASARRRLDRGRGVRRGPRGLLRHHRRRRPRRPRLRHALLPERARGDAAPLDLAAVRHHQPDRRLAVLRRGARDGRAGHRGARHRHVGDPHGVVLRPQGPAVLRDRLPAAGRRRLGPLLRRATTSTSTASGRTRSCTARPSAPMSRAVLRRHRRAAPGPRRPRSAATPASTRSTAATASGSSTPTSRPRHAAPSRSRPATWPTPTCGMRHPDYDTAARHARRRRPDRPRPRRMTDATVLLGPQRFLTTAGTVVRSLGVDGPVATVTAGWQEREGDDAELRRGAGRPQPQPRPLRPAARRARDRRREFAAAALAHRDAMDELAGIYSLRLQHALDSVYAVPAPAGARRHRRRRARRRRSRVRARASTTGTSALVDQLYAELEAAAPVDEQRADRSGTGRRSPSCSVGAAALAIAGGHVGVLLRCLQAVRGQPAGASCRSSPGRPGRWR